LLLQPEGTLTIDFSRPATEYTERSERAMITQVRAPPGVAGLERYEVVGLYATSSLVVLAFVLLAFSPASASGEGVLFICALLGLPLSLLDLMAAGVLVWQRSVATALGLLALALPCALASGFVLWMFASD
jgi:hypothetical protein